MIEAEAQLAAGQYGVVHRDAQRRAHDGVRARAAHRPGHATGRVRTCCSASARSGCTRPRTAWATCAGSIRQYGRGTETVFPTGAYFKGGSYGTDVTLVPSQQETNNPNWQACTDKNA